MLHGRMLRYLDVVARVGSIRKAATVLNVASSAINRQIIALEEELGEPLFERMPRRLRLTATGEVLIEHVRATLKAHTHTLERIEAMRGLHRGTITLATSFGLAAGPMAQIVSEYLSLHNRVQIRLTSAATDMISNMVISGESTLGLGFAIPPRPGLKTLFTMDVPLGAIVATDHPLAGATAIKLRGILSYPLVLAPHGMSMRHAVDLALSRFDLITPPVLETNSVELIRRFVSRSQAVALLNPLDVGEDVANGVLAYVPIADENLHPQSLRLVARTKDHLDPITSNFSQHLTGILHDLVDDARRKPNEEGAT